MIISLPERYPIEANTVNQVFIENGILNIGRRCRFKSVMYMLTYIMKGNTVCYYCGQTIEEWQMTLDHIYPRDLGGPTIIDNLVPCCKECNSEKNNFTLQQYQEMLKIKQKQNEKKVEEFKKEIDEEREKLRKSKKYYLPSEWVDIVKLKDINLLYIKKFPYRKTKMYREARKFYNKYKMLKSPIVVDRELQILDGFIVYMFAKDKKLERVPIIRLENVELR